MGREIEFRAYSTVTGTFDFFTIKDLLTKELRKVSEKCFEDDLTVEKFTGLLDCNGVKIFEGDIVHHLEPLDYEQMVVNFYDGAFRVKIGRWVMVLNDLYIKSNELVVIGNIHQNPELLA